MRRMKRQCQWVVEEVTISKAETRISLMNDKSRALYGKCVVQPRAVRWGDERREEVEETEGVKGRERVERKELEGGEMGDREQWMNALSLLEGCPLRSVVREVLITSVFTHARKPDNKMRTATENSCALPYKFHQRAKIGDELLVFSEFYLSYLQPLEWRM